MPRDTRTLIPPVDDIILMEDIRKVYDTGKVKVEALKGVSFTVKKGEFVAIVGPSGSGKSTLMNLIGCLDTPTSGVYRLGGEAVAGLSRDQLADVRNRRVGFVFQSFNLLPQISAFENVEMPLLFGGVAPKERRARAAELLAKVGLGDRLDHKPTELSGGQMQRVAVARALAMTPDLLLADEPTGNLDSTSGGDIMGLFTDLWNAGGTLIVITHDMSLARRAGPRHRGARRAHPEGLGGRGGLKRDESGRKKSRRDFPTLDKKGRAPARVVLPDLERLDDVLEAVLDGILQRGALRLVADLEDRLARLVRWRRAPSPRRDSPPSRPTCGRRRSAPRH